MVWPTREMSDSPHQFARLASLACIMHRVNVGWTGGCATMLDPTPMHLLEWRSRMLIRESMDAARGAGVRQGGRGGWDPGRMWQGRGRDSCLVAVGWRAAGRGGSERANVGQVSGKALEKCWASVGQVLDKCWTSVGQVLDKRWTRVGQIADNRSTNVAPQSESEPWTTAGARFEDTAGEHCRHHCGAGWPNFCGCRPAPPTSRRRLPCPR